MLYTQLLIRVKTAVNSESYIRMKHNNYGCGFCQCYTCDSVNLIPINIIFIFFKFEPTEYYLLDMYMLYILHHHYQWGKIKHMSK